jgi:pimeloyl-ACP methyl ester carboxylesterase
VRGGKAAEDENPLTIRHRLRPDASAGAVVARSGSSLVAVAPRTVPREDELVVGAPQIRYANNGPWQLAYQVLGDGPDLLYLPGWVSNVEGNWLAPDHARFLERLASLARTIVVDRRGIGCSDRLPPGETTTLEEGVEDLRMIARAAQSSRAAVFGVQEGGFYALLAAATHPERSPS